MKMFDLIFYIKGFTELKEYITSKPVLCIGSHLAETEAHVDALPRVNVYAVEDDSITERKIKESGK